MLGIGNYFWRLIPANPILLRVVESGGKRKRDLLFRCGYLGILLLVVMWQLLPALGGMASASLADLSKQSQSIFWWMSYFQLGLVALLAPVFTAGAITQEKDSQTYDILLSTPLTNGQIVLGSLLSRLFFVIALLISGIPIFSITQIFGGVAISSIVTSFLIAAATAFVTGALAMAIAVFKVGTRRTIFSFYLAIVLYIAVPLTLENMGFFQVPGAKKDSHCSWMAGLHPFLSLKVIFGDPKYMPPEPAQVAGWGYGRLIQWYLSSPQTFYPSFMMFLSLVLVTPSIIFLRRLAQSQQTFRRWALAKLHLVSSDRTRKPRHVWSNPIAWREAKTKASANRAVILRYGFMIGGIAAAVLLVVLSATKVPASLVIGSDAYNPQYRTVTIVEDGNPKVYRLKPNANIKLRIDLNDAQKDQPLQPEDLRREMVIAKNQSKADEIVKDGETIIAQLIVQYPEMVLSTTRTKQFLLGAAMIELAVILLIVTQSAASTVTREKEDGTLDLLLSTPITSRYYIWGKLRGLVSFVLPLMAVPVVSILLFVVVDLFRSKPWLISGASDWTVNPEAILVLPGTLVMSAAFAAMVGMHMSLRCRKTVIAVMLSMLIVNAALGGLWFCGGKAAGAERGGFELPGIAIGSFSPFTLLGLLVDPQSTAPAVFGPAQNSAFSGEIDPASARMMIFFAGWAATALYGFLVWWMYKSMVHNFDMTIRKQAT